MRHDPGPCLICGAPHSACTADDGVIAIAQTPAKDAAVAAAIAETPAPAEPFTTGTYRRKKTPAPIAGS